MDTSNKPAEAPPDLDVMPAPDLGKLRDEKCIPVARDVMLAMAELMIPENASEKIDYNPLALKILQLELDADLNVTTEQPFVDQLILGALSGLNKTVQASAYIPIDDIRYGNIARKILVILNEGNVTLGNVTPEQTEADFAPVKEKINALFAEEKLMLIEVKYVMDNIFQSFAKVGNIVTESISQSMKSAEEKLWGVEDLTDVCLKQVDEVLHAAHETGAVAPTANMVGASEVPGADQAAA